MREIENKWFFVLISQGYENAILRVKGKDWLSERVQRITRILFKADLGISAISLVFDTKIKKAAWFKENDLLLNLAKDDAVIMRDLQAVGMPVYTAEEIELMSQELPDLRVKYIKGDEAAGEKYFKFSEAVLRFSG